MLHPNSLFHRYKKMILNLERIERDSVQNEQFVLHQDACIRLYYAPHNEYINENATILIIGITPGWNQTQRAYQTAKRKLELCCSDEEVCFQCKIESRFVGSMRKNLIAMLDDLGLQKRLDLMSCANLFHSDNNLLHTTSLIKYPCFYNGKNYNGHTPKISSVEILHKYIETEFAEELRCVNHAKLIIPLGTAVEGILREELNYLPVQNCEVLWGFPHPSGANAHRMVQFQSRREDMSQILGKCNL